MANDPMKREATSSVRAYDYQKLRALILLLENLGDEDACATIEYLDDVFLQKNVSGEAIDHVEQVKDYEGEDAALSFNSAPVRKSISNFLETWLDHRRGGNLRFCLCITTKISKERSTALLEKLGVTLPTESVLTCIKNKAIDKILEIVKRVIQYDFENDSGRKDFVQRVSAMSDGDWFQFLNQIAIEDSSVEYAKLSEKALELLRQRDYLKAQDDFDEARLFDRLIGFLTSRFSKSEFSARLIRTTDIKLKIIEELKGVNKTIDPAGELTFETDDVRSLKEKIISVCGAYRPKDLSVLQRRSAMFMSEERKLSTNPAFSSFRIRVYDKCDEILNDHIRSNGNRPMTSEEIGVILENLKLEAHRSLLKLSADYSYPLTNEVSVEGLILNLFDSCFLAFDEA